MKFLSAADFDDAITAASKIRAATSYALLAVGAANTAYTSGNFEAYVPVGQYATGVRPGYGFYAAGVLGTYLYAETAAELRLRTSTGLDYTMWNSGNSRSDAQNDTRYSQLGHTHPISEVIGLQSALDAKATVSGTVGRLTKIGSANTLVESIATEISGAIQIAGVYRSDTLADVNARGLTVLTSGVGRWIAGKAGLESGSNSGSDWVFWRLDDSGSFLGEALRLSRANGNATFVGSITASGGNSGNWNSAFSWGNHASAGYALSSALSGYVPTSRTLTINGTTFDLSANRSWTISSGVTGTGTSGTVPQFTGASIIGDSIITISGINATVAGQFVSDIAPSGTGSRGFGFFASGSARWTVGKFGLETGSNAGSNLVFYRFNDAGAFIGEAMSINRATGNVTYSGSITASGGNSGNWNTAFSWGNHASAGYVPSTRTLTINGTTLDLSANRSWTVAAGVGGGGTAGTIPAWVTGSTLGDSSITEDSTYVTTSKWVRIGYDGANRYLEHTATPTLFTSTYYNADSAAGWMMLTAGDIFAVGTFGYSPSVAFHYKPEGNFAAFVPANANARGFVLGTTAGSGSSRWNIGKAGLETGSNAGSDLVFWAYDDAAAFLRENLRISRASGNATFSGIIAVSGGNSGNWNTAYGWGNHASAGYALSSSLSGYVPTSRTITINGTSFDLSANRSWTVAGGIGGIGTAGKIPKLATSTTLADSILTESGINITAAGQFISDVAHNSNVRGYGLQASGVNRWTFGKAGAESGSDSGSDFTLWSYSDAGAFVREPLRISRASGNATFSGLIAASGGNSGNWNLAYGWGNHATAGYATLSYLSTNYYDKTSVNSMVSGFVPDSRSVTGTGSIQGGGNLGINRTLNLYGDQDNPGTNKYYGTDGSGGKGWYNLPSGGGGITGSGSLNMFTKWSGSGSVTTAEMYEVSGAIYIGSMGNRRDLYVQGSIIPNQMTASQRASYSPGGIGAIVYQVDGTVGWWGAKDNGSGGYTWVFIA